MWMNAPTKRCPTLDALITVSTCPEAPNASALPATSFVPIRKLAKVKNQQKTNRFNQIRSGAKKVLGVVGKKKITTNAPRKMEAVHTSASISKAE
jgi:hypothetical protein